MPSLPALTFSRQLILVVAPDWASPAAELRRFERSTLAEAWQPAGEAIKVTLGRSGLAWGIGLHTENSVEGGSKREGDGCAPAGVFALTGLFGNAAQDSTFARAAKLPYLRAYTDLKCIDDPQSCHYNRIVDQGEVDAIDWQSHEEMLRPDQRYAVGAVIAHNSTPPLAGAGSCIFLHVWQDEDSPTAGCTAGSFENISEICQWLDGNAAPLLVQLPLAEYLRFKDAWQLP